MGVYRPRPHVLQDILTSMTYAGCISMRDRSLVLAGGTAMALAFITFFAHMGYFHMREGMLPVVAASALAATVAESLPVSDVLDDNLTVPVVAASSAALLLSDFC